MLPPSHHGLQVFFIVIVSAYRLIRRAGIRIDELEGYVRKLHKNATPMLLERCNELTKERGHALLGSTKVDHSILDRSSVASAEQKFGVEQKEVMKARAPSVDMLLLTATPILRTLSLCQRGIYELSLLLEAPDGRKPIQTQVGARGRARVPSSTWSSIYTRRGRRTNMNLGNATECGPAGPPRIWIGLLQS